MSTDEGDVVEVDLESVLIGAKLKTFQNAKLVANDLGIHITLDGSALIKLVPWKKITALNLSYRPMRTNELIVEANCEWLDNKKSVTSPFFIVKYRADGIVPIERIITKYKLEAKARVGIPHRLVEKPFSFVYHKKLRAAWALGLEIVSKILLVVLIFALTKAYILCPKPPKVCPGEEAPEPCVSTIEQTYSYFEELAKSMFGFVWMFIEPFYDYAFSTHPYLAYAGLALVSVPLWPILLPYWMSFVLFFTFLYTSQYIIHGFLIYHVWYHFGQVLYMIRDARNTLRMVLDSTQYLYSGGARIAKDIKSKQRKKALRHKEKKQ